MLEQPTRSVAPAVPFLDLRPTHDGLKAQLLAEISDLIDSNAFTNGPQVAKFERRFAEYCGTEDCVGVASGLDALRLGLIAAGVEPGDEVIVPAATFVATFEAVSQVGAVPVVVDVSELDYAIDVEAAAHAVSPRTRALMPVHLYGQMADMRALAGLASAHRLRVIEDACQAHGASRDGRRAGALGLAAAFSFYPGKNLGAFGDAGALVTNDPELARRVRALREHGQAAKYQHEVEGWTSRLDTIQALALSRKLPHLDRWNEQRRGVAATYSAELADVSDVRLPQVARGSEPVWHLYVIRTKRRDELADFLRERRVATGLHYPEPPHLSRAYAHLGLGRGRFPVAEALSRECLSLPIFPGISAAQIAAVVDAVKEFFAGGR